MNKKGEANYWYLVAIVAIVGVVAILVLTMRDSTTAADTAGKATALAKNIRAAPAGSAKMVAGVACNDGLDNDNDLKCDYQGCTLNINGQVIDAPADPGCTSATDNNEYNAPPNQTYACSDSIDNDNDNYCDYKGCWLYHNPPLSSDPYWAKGDSGCTSATDNDEYNAPPGTSPGYKCSDGIDNDGDGYCDYEGCWLYQNNDPYWAKADPGCTSATDNDEYNAPPSPSPGYKCSDGIDNDGDLKCDYQGCWLYHNPIQSGDPYFMPADPGCTSATDNDEYNAPPTPTYACNDGVDNDGDGYCDYQGCTLNINGQVIDAPADPGCSSEFDNDEKTSSIQCDNNIDDDTDGFCDYSGCLLYHNPPQSGDPYWLEPDPACSSPGDNYEAWTVSEMLSNNDIELTECRDKNDNDGDGKCDKNGCWLYHNPPMSSDPYWAGADPDCASLADNTERYMGELN